MRSYVMNLQSRCYDAADGKLDDEQMKALADEAMGAFGRLPIFGTSVREAVNKKNWNMLAGAIGSCLQVDSQSDKMSVTQTVQNSAESNSSASSNANASINAVFDLIDSDEGLSDEEKAKLQSLLIDAKKEAKKKDSGAFAEIGAKALEGVKNATPQVVSGVLSFLASAAARAFGA